MNNNTLPINNALTAQKEIQGSVTAIGTKLTYRVEHYHNRFIAADNGWKITLGRGLDIFEKIEGLLTWQIWIRQKENVNRVS
jgi:ATP-dependent Lon protease